MAEYDIGFDFHVLDFVIPGYQILFELAVLVDPDIKQYMLTPDRIIDMAERIEAASIPDLLIYTEEYQTNKNNLRSEIDQVTQNYMVNHSRHAEFMRLAEQERVVANQPYQQAPPKLNRQQRRQAARRANKRKGR